MLGHVDWSISVSQNIGAAKLSRGQMIYVVFEKEQWQWWYPPPLISLYTLGFPVQCVKCNSYKNGKCAGNRQTCTTQGGEKCMIRRTWYASESKYVFSALENVYFSFRILSTLSKILDLKKKNQLMSSYYMEPCATINIWRLIKQRWTGLLSAITLIWSPVFWFSTSLLFMVCHNYFSIPMTKHHDQDFLSKKYLIWG